MNKEKILAEIADIIRPGFSGSRMADEAGYDAMKAIEQILTAHEVDKYQIARDVYNEYWEHWDKTKGHGVRGITEWLDIHALPEPPKET